MENLVLSTAFFSMADMGIHFNVNISKGQKKVMDCEGNVFFLKVPKCMSPENISIDFERRELSESTGINSVDGVILSLPLRANLVNSKQKTSFLIIKPGDSIILEINGTNIYLSMPKEGWTIDIDVTVLGDEESKQQAA